MINKIFYRLPPILNSYLFSNEPTSQLGRIYSPIWLDTSRSCRTHMAMTGTRMISAWSGTKTAQGPRELPLSRRTYWSRRQLTLKIRYSEDKWWFFCHYYWGILKSTIDTESARKTRHPPSCKGATWSTCTYRLHAAKSSRIFANR